MKVYYVIRIKRKYVADIEIVVKDIYPVYTQFKDGGLKFYDDFSAWKVGFALGQLVGFKDWGIEICREQEKPKEEEVEKFYLQAINGDNENNE